MSELPAGIPRAEPPEPRDSALGIVMRRGPGGRWETLLGKRSRGSSFLPGHLAFLGGGLDPEDEPGRPGAFERCATRELREESGLSIDASAWRDAGIRITPPIFPVRFNTRFLLAEAPDGAVLPDELPSPGEIASLEFHRPAEVLESWRCGRVLVPPPVLNVLRALVGREAAGAEELAALLLEVNTAEQHLPRVEFLPEVWLVPVRTPTLPPATHTNSWLPGRRRFAIVDPGSEEPGELDRLAGIVARRAEEGSRPAAILLTHHHRDHVGGAEELARRLGLPVWAHPETLDRIELDGAVERRPLHDGDRLDMDGLTLRAFHTPGHAAGHLALHLPERQALIAGDLISGLSTILVDPADGDMGTYLASLRRMAELDCRRLLPAHGPPLPGRALAHLIEHRSERERCVLDALSHGPRPLADIAREAYADAPSAPQLLAEMQALAHLLHLETQGRVQPEGASRRRWRALD